jgi:uncharacterized protein (DUF1501 family)
MKRRQFLKLAGLTPLVLSVARPVFATAGAPSSDRILVLVELAGGNDGLNTVIPFRDPRYYALRPDLGVPADTVLDLGGGLGFNPALAPLMDSWAADDLAIVLGVGYPQPNRSHFRSIEIWETGSDSDEYLGDGWLTRLMQSIGTADLVADGIVLGDTNTGPLQGGARALVVDDTASFLENARRLHNPTAHTENAALAHILNVQRDVVDAASIIDARVRTAPDLGVDFGRSDYGRQLETAAMLCAAEVPVGVIKVTLGGFDTHSNQRAGHDRLLGRLAEGLANFRSCLRGLGRWDDVLVMTYSEFGRRVAENGSNGTDHGTAAPHFMLGGQIHGGFYGEQPSLDDLDGGDLRHNVDFRSLYTTVARRWWDAEMSALGGGFDVIDCV